MTNGTRRGWVVSSAPPAALYPRERPNTHCTGGWVSPRAGLGSAENLAATGIRSLDRPACSQSLYWLHYPAHLYFYYYIQIPLTSIPKTTAHSFYCICKVLGETHNRSNDVGKLKCQWVPWLCKSDIYDILLTNNLNISRNNGLWKIQYKLIWIAVIIFTLN